MLKILTPSNLRANSYRILDHVLESGKPVAIKRKGRRLFIVGQAALLQASLITKDTVIHQHYPHAYWE